MKIGFYYDGESTAVIVHNGVEYVFVRERFNPKVPQKSGFYQMSEKAAMDYMEVQPGGSPCQIDPEMLIAPANALEFEMDAVILHRLARYSAVKDIRSYLNGVYFGASMLASTDGHRLAFMDKGLGADREHIVPTSFIKLLPKKGRITLKFSDDYVFCENITAKTISGKYPDVAFVIKSHSNLLYKTVVSHAGLKNAVNLKPYAVFADGDALFVTLKGGTRIEVAKTEMDTHGILFDPQYLLDIPDGANVRVGDSAMYGYTSDGVSYLLMPVRPLKEGK